MSARPEAAAGTPADVCPLCGRPVVSGAPRCGSCGLHQDFGEGRPNPFTRASLWALAGLLATVYAATLVAVAIAR